MNSIYAFLLIVYFIFPQDIFALKKKYICTNENCYIRPEITCQDGTCEIKTKKEKRKTLSKYKQSKKRGKRSSKNKKINQPIDAFAINRNRLITMSDYPTVKSPIIFQLYIAKDNNYIKETTIQYYLETIKPIINQLKKNSEQIIYSIQNSEPINLDLHEHSLRFIINRLIGQKIKISSYKIADNIAARFEEYLSKDHVQEIKKAFEIFDQANNFLAKEYNIN